jgi:hypothetical protein
MGRVDDDAGAGGEADRRVPAPMAEQKGMPSDDQLCSKGRSREQRGEGDRVSWLYDSSSAGERVGLWKVPAPEAVRLPSACLRVSISPESMDFVVSRRF